MKEQIELLVKLQEEDREADRLKWQIRQGPERIRVLGKELQTIEEDIEADERRIQDLKKSQRQYEADIEDGLAHTRKSRGRLMNIKNNREYRALLKEIEETKKENTAKEDMILSCLEELEGLNEELETKGKSLIAMQDRIKSEETTINKEVARFQEELSDMEKSRKNLIQTIDSRLLAKYKQIKARSGGIAIALVYNATCSECHLSIPPQMYNELQKQDTLKLCPHCQRILYWKKAEAAA
ncbi:MAG: hypothetical protein HWN69_06540 [Desulfobacterales bacterium]|nr:hypothetical protein [Desulfobacterales bacterium]